MYLQCRNHDIMCGHRLEDLGLASPGGGTQSARAILLNLNAHPHSLGGRQCVDSREDVSRCGRREVAEIARFLTKSSFPCAVAYPESAWKHQDEAHNMTETDDAMECYNTVATVG